MAVFLLPAAPLADGPGRAGRGAGVPSRPAPETRPCCAQMASAPLTRARPGVVLRRAGRAEGHALSPAGRVEDRRDATGPDGSGRRHRRPGAYL